MCLHIGVCTWAGPITVETRETQVSNAGVHPGWTVFQAPWTASTRSPLTLLGAQTAAHMEIPTDWSCCLKMGIRDTQGCQRHLHRAGSYNTGPMGGLSSSALVADNLDSRHKVRLRKSARRQWNRTDQPLSHSLNTAATYAFSRLVFTFSIRITVWQGKYLLTWGAWRHVSKDFRTPSLPVISRSLIL